MDKTVQGSTAPSPSPAAEWDVLIAPSSPWWRLNLGEIWRYRDLLVVLVQRDLTALYKQTLLGPIWVIMQPLLTSVMFAVVFGMMGRMSLPGIPPLLFYMAGVVPWTFFAGAVNKTSATLTVNAPLMTKVYFPRLIPPMSATVSACVSFLVQITVFFIFAAFYRFSGTYLWMPAKALIALPVLILLEMAVAFGSGLIVAALTTKYRDLGFLIGFGVQLLMYMSPVIFPLSRVAEGGKLRFVIEANPLTPIIEGFRGALLGTFVDWSTLWYPAVASLILVSGGLALFQRAERSYADVV